MPFGEEISTSQRTPTVGYSGDSVRKQFTGYEGDAETGLDFAQARMFSGPLGRFSSVDPMGLKLAAPQTLNRYAYVENNPLKYIDPTGNTLVINGDNAQSLVEELEKSTGLKLSRCTAVNKEAGCGQVGQILIDTSGSRATGKDISTKLADALTNVISNLKDNKGRDVTVTMNTTRNDPRSWIDSFASRTVDVGDLQTMRNARGADVAKFVAGQLGHILYEYAASAVNKANNPDYIETDEDGNAKTHDAALNVESEIMSELDDDDYGYRLGGKFGEKNTSTTYTYNGKKARVGYTFTWDLDSNGKRVLNVTHINVSSIPINQVPK